MPWFCKVKAEPWFYLWTLLRVHKKKRWRCFYAGSSTHLVNIRTSLYSNCTFQNTSLLSTKNSQSNINTCKPHLHFICKYDVPTSVQLSCAYRSRYSSQNILEVWLTSDSKKHSTTLLLLAPCNVYWSLEGMKINEHARLFFFSLFFFDRTATKSVLYSQRLHLLPPRIIVCGFTSLQAHHPCSPPELLPDGCYGFWIVSSSAHFASFSFELASAGKPESKVKQDDCSSTE